MTPTPARLLSLATAAPVHVVSQDAAVAAARSLFGERYDAFEEMAGVFANAGITTRRLAQPVDWYFQPRDWPQRTAAYLEIATALFKEAAGKALDAAGLTGADVDAVVTVSSTGIATPSLEARAGREMGFRRDVQRTPVFGLGCAGGVSGLGLAARLARAQPGARVLLVVVELCTLSFRLDELSKVNMVATALFGDGAAAAVISTGDGEGLAAIEAAAEHTWPDTLDIMGWQVDAEGFGVIFDRAIPPFARRRMGPAVDAMLSGMGLERADVGRFVCHPGGARVIEALEGALRLAPGSLDAERAVLAEYGNMSAPTALFVLDRVLAAPSPERLFLTALGPGFTASGVSLLRAA
jgi:alkylresorcinol/alkylpyrone synthase